MKKSIKQNRGFGRKVKKFILVNLLLLIGVTYILNCSQFIAFKESVYTQMSEEFTNKTVDVQTEEVTVIQQRIEDNKAVNVETKPVKVEKHYGLTVDTDLRIHSNVTAEEIDRMLEGTALHGLGYAFVEAEQKYNVNALYMVGLAIVESGWGTSRYATERYNLYGFHAYDSNPDLATYFDGWHDSTLHVASYLQKHYLTEGGIYYNGYTPKAVDVKYCTDKRHAYKIVEVVDGLCRKIGVK